LPEISIPRRTAIAAALIAALLVLLAGGVYAAKRHRPYQSQMSFVLVPKHHLGSAIRAGLIESFASSSASGTYVELLASRGSAAGSGVSVRARAVPDTRVIDLTASGPRNAVSPALQTVASAALTGQTSLSDLWSLNVLQEPAAPSRTGTSTTVVLLITLLLGGLAGVAVLVALAQLSPTPRRTAAPEPDAATEDPLALLPTVGNGEEPRRVRQSAATTAAKARR
jgi:hypothetical protein